MNSPRASIIEHLFDIIKSKYGRNIANALFEKVPQTRAAAAFECGVIIGQLFLHN